MIYQKNILASTFLFGENMSKIRATAWAYSGGWQRGQLLPPPPLPKTKKNYHPPPPPTSPN